MHLDFCEEEKQNLTLKWLTVTKETDLLGQQINFRFVENLKMHIKWPKLAANSKYPSLTFRSTAVIMSTQFRDRKMSISIALGCCQVGLLH
jgi:hypothetical protein